MQLLIHAITMLAQSSSSLQNDLIEAVRLMVVGMLVVFTALTLTALAIALLNALDKGSVPPPATHKTPNAQKPSEQQRIAVIAAAAATAVLGKPVRVNNIQRTGQSSSG